MVDRVVVLKVGIHLLSLPFAHVDEILGIEKAVPGTDLPEDAGTGGNTGGLWIHSRGRWLSVLPFLPGQQTSTRCQVVVLSGGDFPRAIVVDQVMGIEKAGFLAPFPDVIRPYMDVSFSGVRMMGDRPVLELDLSGLFSLDIGNAGIE